MMDRKPEVNAYTYHIKNPLVLECGETLQDLKIRYTTLGDLNSEKSNVVWVFHALTGNSDPTEWWPALVGSGKIIDPSEHFIVCANMLGSCYGSTEADGFDFPLITIADQVACFRLLKEHLGISTIRLGIGGSMGGQQLLEWAVQEPSVFETIVPIATNAKHSPWGIAFNETQRMAIKNDPENGIATARAIAMLSYRHYQTYGETQQHPDQRADQFLASSYQNYQGKKLQNRFSPFSYYCLSKAMDSHHVGRGFSSDVEALNRIRSRAIVIGIDTDVLFPVAEQQWIAEHITDSSFHELKSLYGHDGFLIEIDQIEEILKKEL